MVKKFTNQPDLTEQVGAALEVLSRNPRGERVHGKLDNTEVFRVMAGALGLGHGE